MAVQVSHGSAKGKVSHQVFLCPPLFGCAYQECCIKSMQTGADRCVYCCQKGCLHEHGLCLYRVKVPALLDRLRLGFADIQIEATPRRVAVMVSQLAREQKGAQDKVRGPPAKVLPTHHPPFPLCPKLDVPKLNELISITCNPTGLLISVFPSACQGHPPSMLWGF